MREKLGTRKYSLLGYTKPTMRILATLFVTVLLAISPSFAKGGKSSGRSSSARVHVKSYTTKKGKVVKSHDRTAPNGTKRDNWSTKGNTNPETGKPGTKDPNK